MPWQIRGLNLCHSLCVKVLVLGVLSEVAGESMIYNYSSSTEDNFSVDKFVLVGKYAYYRRILDYSFHKYYSPERQLLQDNIIDNIRRRVGARKAAVTVNERTMENQWIVYTAGPMGCGKSHTLDWLHANGLFDRLYNLIRVDPDDIREMLPEFSAYCAVDISTVGLLTQKEVGYIAEILVLATIADGQSVIVDSSLRDDKWHNELFKVLRLYKPHLKIGIIEVTASLNVCRKRAQVRALRTGRQVPDYIIRDSFEKSPKSVASLRRFTNFTCTFYNEHDKLVPLLMQVSSCGEIIYMYNNCTGNNGPQHSAWNICSQQLLRQNEAVSTTKSRLANPIDETKALGDSQIQSNKKRGSDDSSSAGIGSSGVPFLYY